MSLASDICDHLGELRSSKRLLAHDIEGYPTSGVSVCSFAWSASEALSVPLLHCNHGRFWSSEDEAEIMAALKALLEDAEVPKVGHNISYEFFTWSWAHQITMRGIADDTMLKFAELYPELDKSLEMAASILTKEPYWKHGADTTDDLEFAKYNATDSLVTFEINERMASLLDEQQIAHYRHQMALLELSNQQALDGMAFDTEARGAMLKSLEQQAVEAQGALDAAAGLTPPTLTEVAQTVCNKRRLADVKQWADVEMAAKPTFEKTVKRIVALAKGM